VPTSNSRNLNDLITWTGRGSVLQHAVPLGTLWLLAAIGIYISAMAFQQSHPQRWLVLPFAALFLLMALAFTFIFRKSDSQQITINKLDGLIEFDRVFLLSGFLPRTATFSCRVSELRLVELAAESGGGADWLYIHTPRGRVLVHSGTDRFDLLRSYLLANAPKGAVPITARHWFPGALAAAIVVIALIIAFACGWLP
jgi:hypothetical protein